MKGDDIITSNAFKAFGLGTIVKLCLLILIVIYHGVTESLFAYGSATAVALWVICEIFLIFLPNLFRHKRRWARSEEYRVAALKRSEEIGALRTIYSDLLDKY